ncbi:hypothetical protein [Heyndrickxia acidicola]|uniref:Uncharacterized protein n=1 Tax=Heyndrickxia acidicola TaxID=209389 RepID=A0ABU6MMD2_9BACI|nr:hypothetical protein [Heyndrickxia acidicola]MED1205454.1 hypothetical protein [Heyndrickxia acidicola]
MAAGHAVLNGIAGAGTIIGGIEGATSISSGKHKEKVVLKGFQATN